MPIGNVIALLIANSSQIPGSGCTTPNPVNAPSPTHPDQIATNAGNASSSTGHHRTGRVAAGVSTGTATCTGSSTKIGVLDPGVAGAAGEVVSVAAGVYAGTF